ncbi:MAG: hypothetical protein ACW98F_10840 [Candidatus Hodarchaeales archaeon]
MFTLIFLVLVALILFIGRLPSEEKYKQRKSNIISISGGLWVLIGFIIFLFGCLLILGALLVGAWHGEYAFLRAILLTICVILLGVLNIRMGLRLLN